MGKYVLNRVLQAIPALMGVAVVVFVLLRAIPGDPAILRAGPEPTDEMIEAIRHDLGLDQPLPVQFLAWLRLLVRGDFGRSFMIGRTVAELIRASVPATLELAAGGLVLTLLIGIPLGIIAGTHRGTKWDLVVSGFSAVSLGVPVFWVGILLIMVFSLRLGWLPPGGRARFSEGVLPALKSLLLPSLSVGIVNAPNVTRFLRNAIIEILHEDYVRTARAKGLPEVIVFARHIMRNALIPVVTILGVIISQLIGGVVIAESIFSWPGMGRLIVTAIFNRDYNLVQTCLLLIVTVCVVVNMVVDIMYGWLDPRIRTG